MVLVRSFNFGAKSLPVLLIMNFTFNFLNTVSSWIGQKYINITKFYALGQVVKFIIRI
jgi:hypothetical protein